MFVAASIWYRWCFSPGFVKYTLCSSNFWHRFVEEDRAACFTYGIHEFTCLVSVFSVSFFAWYHEFVLNMVCIMATYSGFFRSLEKYHLLSPETLFI